MANHIKASIQKHVHTCLSWLIYGLCRLVPKRNAAVVFSVPAFEDMAQALLPALKRTHIQTIYHLVDHPKRHQKMLTGDLAGIILLKRLSLRGIWTFSRCRYVFGTLFAYTRRYPRNMVSVNVWHGMPIKKVCAYYPGRRVCAKYDLATSHFWEPIIRKGMNPWGEVLIAELPRNERFYAIPPEEIKKRLGGEALTCKKLLIGLPTYRVAGEKIDAANPHHALPIPDFQFAPFQAWLEANQILCIIKPHYLANLTNARNTGYLRFLNENALRELDISLYPLLGASDALLTDISSVYVDYLLLNRPIFHLFGDQDAYTAARGFTFDWSAEYHAGPMLRDMAGLMDALQDWQDGRDAFQARRTQLKERFHEFPAEGATERLLSLVGLPPK